MSDAHRIAQLERQVATLIREGQRRQVVPWNGPRQQTVTILEVATGNAIIATSPVTINGIKVNSTSMTVTVPATSPTYGTVYSDGIGCGWITDPSTGSRGSFVWIVNCDNMVNGVSTGSLVRYHLPEGSRLISLLTIDAVVGAGPSTAKVYLAWRV